MMRNSEHPPLQSSQGHGRRAYQSLKLPPSSKKRWCRNLRKLGRPSPVLRCPKRVLLADVSNLTATLMMMNELSLFPMKTPRHSLRLSVAIFCRSKTRPRTRLIRSGMKTNQWTRPLRLWNHFPSTPILSFVVLTPRQLSWKFWLLSLTRRTFEITIVHPVLHRRYPRRALIVKANLKYPTIPTQITPFPGRITRLHRHLPSRLPQRRCSNLPLAANWITISQSFRHSRLVLVYPTWHLTPYQPKKCGVAPSKVRLVGRRIVDSEDDSDDKHVSDGGNPSTAITSPQLLPDFLHRTSAQEATSRFAGLEIHSNVSGAPELPFKWDETTQVNADSADSPNPDLRSIPQPRTSSSTPPKPRARPLFLSESGSQSDSQIDGEVGRLTQNPRGDLRDAPDTALYVEIRLHSSASDYI